MTQSNEPTIEQINRTICEFIGWEFKEESPDWFMAYFEGKKQWADDGRGLNKIFLEGFKFHEDWNKLMPVVEKIESIHDEFHGYFGVHISSNGCTIQGTKFDTRPGKEHYAYFNDVVHETKIKATHNAIYQFITWLNQQKQPNVE